MWQMVQMGKRVTNNKILRSPDYEGDWESPHFTVFTRIWMKFTCSKGLIMDKENLICSTRTLSNNLLEEFFCLTPCQGSIAWVVHQGFLAVLTWSQLKTDRCLMGHRRTLTYYLYLSNQETHRLQDLEGEKLEARGLWVGSLPKWKQIFDPILFGHSLGHKDDDD